MANINGVLVTPLTATLADSGKVSGIAPSDATGQPSQAYEVDMLQGAVAPRDGSALSPTTFEQRIPISGLIIGAGGELQAHSQNKIGIVTFGTASWSSPGGLVAVADPTRTEIRQPEGMDRTPRIWRSHSSSLKQRMDNK